MNGEINGYEDRAIMDRYSSQISERPHVIKDVTDANLNDLLASLAQKGAWVLSMTRKGAIYTLNIAWRKNDDPAPS